MAAALKDTRTPDIGGKATTAEFTASVLRHLAWLRFVDVPSSEASSEWAV